MIQSVKQLVLAGLVVAGAVIVFGCEGQPGRPPFEASALVGNWIEVADQASINPRMRGAGAGKTEYRYLVLNADNTFEFSVRDKSGKPAKGDNKIEGSWQIKKSELVFTVTNSTFPKADERNDWAPETSLGIEKKQVQGRGITEVLTVVDLTGMPTTFVRTE